MMNESDHDLHAVFPAQREILAGLELSSAPYRELANRHNLLTQEISRIEQTVERSSDDRLETLKKQYVNVLDQIAALIAEKLPS